jgi:hypothetical protein
MSATDFLKARTSVIADRHVRVRAIKLLSMLANQSSWNYGARTMPGYGARWSRARTLVHQVLTSPAVRAVDVDQWQLAYATAARLLRDGWKPSALGARPPEGTSS